MAKHLYVFEVVQVQYASVEADSIADAKAKIAQGDYGVDDGQAPKPRLHTLRRAT